MNKRNSRADISEEESSTADEPLPALSEYDKTELIAVLDRTPERLSSLEAKCWNLVLCARKGADDPDPRLAAMNEKG